jgi:hypothetical protein
MPTLGRYQHGTATATLRKSQSVAESKKSSSSNRSARGGAYKDVDQVGGVLEQNRVVRPRPASPGRSGGVGVERAVLARHTPRDLARVEQELNRRPRMILADRTPAELFDELLASQNHPQLR